MKRLSPSKQVALLVVLTLAVAATVTIYGVVSSKEDARFLSPASVAQEIPGGAGQLSTGSEAEATSLSTEKTAPQSPEAGSAAKGSDTGWTPPVVDLSRYRPLLPKDAIRPVYEPIFAAGKLTSLEPGELVIGVEIGGESKAYPVGPLNRREMVKDVVGGVPVLVTW